MRKVPKRGGGAGRALVPLLGNSALGWHCEGYFLPPASLGGRRGGGGWREPARPLDSALSGDLVQAALICRSVLFGGKRSALPLPDLDGAVREGKAFALVFRGFGASRGEDGVPATPRGRASPPPSDLRLPTQPGLWGEATRAATIPCPAEREEAGVFQVDIGVTIRARISQDPTPHTCQEAEGEWEESPGPRPLRLSCSRRRRENPETLARFLPGRGTLRRRRWQPSSHTAFSFHGAMAESGS